MPHPHLRAYVDRYFAPHPAGEIKAVLRSRVILNLAIGLLSVYQAVFLYRNGFSAPLIVVFYGSAYLLYLILLPLAGRVCRRHGYEQAMLLSSPFLVLHVLSLMAIPMSHWAAVPAIVFLAAYKFFYWPGYHSCFATWCKTEEDGREVSNVNATASSMNILAPALGGLIAESLGFPSLFLVASALITLSVVPLLHIRHAYVPQPFPYLEAWRRLFARRDRRLLLTTMGFGEDAVTTAVWPVFIVLAVPSVAVIGALVSLASFANTVLLLQAGRLADERRGRRGTSVHWGAAGVVLSWVLRPFLASGYGVFFINFLHSFSGQFVGVPYTADLYEDAKRHGVMERIILMDMALNLGRVVAATVAFVALVLWPGSWGIVFGVTAVLSSLLFLFRPSAKAA